MSEGVFKGKGIGDKVSCGVLSLLFIFHLVLQYCDRHKSYSKKLIVIKQLLRFTHWCFGHHDKIIVFLL